MTKEEFIEEAFELAFGDNALNREFTYKEVIEKLKEFSDRSLVEDAEEWMEILTASIIRDGCGVGEMK